MEFASTQTLTRRRGLKKTGRMEFASTQTLTRRRGLKNGGKNYILRYFLESAHHPDIVCLDAVSTAVFS